MPKLIAQIFAAVGAWVVLALCHVPPLWRIPVLLAGVVAVHIFWERVVFNPHLYLGAMPVDDDDPIMLKAREQAAASFAQFRKLYPEHKEDSMVKFSFQTDSGTTEHLWADLLELSETSANVYVRTPPIEHKGPTARTQTIPVDDIVDWQIEFHDGTIRGGFTNRALFNIFEREEGHLHPKLRGELERFKELEDEGNA
ncbi:MAG: DUF2314 domain-containing protein [Armatimonadota bacterium]|jgi:uncharacterized protein YegJ (DUF2314 family)